MILTRDGRGEFILVAESQDRYEEFATSEEAFASVSSSWPNETGYKTFHLVYMYDDEMETWPEGWEERVLVKARQRYGKRRKIRDLKFDLRNAYGPLVEIAPNDGTCDVRIRIRAITTEFDPETVTWNWAYGENNLGLSEEYADYLLTTGQGAMDASGLPSRGNTPLGSWNELEEIYGFELRIEPMGTEREWLQAQWNARLESLYAPVGYVILA